MRKLIFIAFIFVSAFSFSQKASSLSGMLTDLESNNQPLVYAKVVVKESGLETLSDEKGFFEFKNLDAGNYTLIYSFAGYETKEVQVDVKSNKSNHLNLALAAKTISFEDMMSAMTKADLSTQEDTSTLHK